MSDYRSASTSPRRPPVAAETSRNGARHQQPLADSNSNLCCDGVSAVPLRRFGTGGSLGATGFADTRPHLIARANALETTLAMLRTVFADNGRGSLDFRKCPPDSSSRLHSFARCKGLISVI